MYIKRVEITNIRSIESLTMEFKSQAGWHVLIGDNGAGKSTIIRSIALALIGPDDAPALRLDWADWLSQRAPKGQIRLVVEGDQKYDFRTGSGRNPDYYAYYNTVDFSREKTDKPVKIAFKNKTNPMNWKVAKGWFSVAYGPFRRFTGGSAEKEKMYYSNPKAGAHLSAFGEDVALSEALIYLRELYVRKLEDKPDGVICDLLIQFVNRARLLPHNVTIEDIDSEGVYFRDANGQVINAVQMSDGFRSILSLTFELIRQLIHTYGYQKVFRNSDQQDVVIDLPGVVLIDEIDAHLHPTWQTRIGQWFTQYFPAIQFIVTTHSPLVCRAAEKGSIWRLAAPGSQQTSGEVTGVERDRLIYGNVLDAYSTEAFGQDVERSELSKDKLQRLAHLSQLSSYGQISGPEKKELQTLRTILITDDTTEF